MGIQGLHNHFIANVRKEVEIYDIPVELLSEIFKNVIHSCFTSNHHKELRKQFTSLCLTSRSFYSIAHSLRMPYEFHSYLKQHQLLPIDPEENSSSTKIWRQLFETWEGMKTLFPKMTEQDFRDAVLLLKNEAVNDNTPVIDVQSFRVKLLQNASMLGHLFVVKLVLHHPNISADKKADSLMEAAVYGHLEVVKEFLKDTLISADHKGFSLIYAAMEGWLEVVRELLKDPSISAHHRGESLTYVVSDKRLEVVKELLKDPLISEDHKKESLKHAREYGHLKVIKALEDNLMPQQMSKMKL